MSAENAQEFFRLINIILSSATDNEIRNQTLEKFKLHLQDPTSIFLLFLVIQQASQEKSIRQYCIIVIKSILPVILPQLSPEQIQQTCAFFIQHLQAEPEFLLRRNLCEAISQIPLELWPNICDFANQLLLIEQLHTTGLYLWELISFRLDDDQQSKVAPFLIEAARNAMVSQNSNFRIAGIQLMQQVLSLKFDYSHLVTMLVATFQTILQESFYTNPNDREAKAITELLSEYLTSSRFFSDSYVNEFAIWAVNAVVDSNLPIQYRLYAYRIIDDDDDVKFSAPMAFLLMEPDFDTVKQYLDAFIQLSIDILSQDRTTEDCDYQFFSGFLLNASGSFEGDIIFDYVWAVCNTLMSTPNVINRLLSLFLLYTIVDTQLTPFIVHINDVMHFLLDWSENDDEIDHIELCELLCELAANIPETLSSFIDPISEVLMKKIQHPKSLPTLDTVLRYTIRPPRELQVFLQNLITLLNEATAEQAQSLFSCIESCISCIEKPIEEIYVALSPVLTTALHNPELKCAALRCFTQLAKISPQSYQADIDSHVKLLAMILQTDEIYAIIDAVLCLKEIASNCIFSLVPYLNDLFPLIINLLKLHPIKPSRNDVNDQDIDLQESILVCIASLVAYMPNHIPPVARQFRDLLTHCVNHNVGLYEAVCRSIVIAADGFKDLGMIDIFDILLPLIQEISKTDIRSLIIWVHKAISALLMTFGNELALKYLTEIKQPLIRGLSGLFDNVYFPFGRLSSSIDIHLLAPIFECLDRFIGALGPSATPYVDEIYRALKSYLFNQNKLYCVYPLEIFSHICFIDPGYEDLYLMTIDKCVVYLNDGGHIIIQTLLTKSFRYLLYSNKEGLAAYQPMLIEFCEGIIRSDIDYIPLRESATSLWCGLIMEFDLQPNEEVLEAVINSLPPRFDSDDLPFVSVFAVYVARKWPDVGVPKMPFVAAKLLASNNYFISETADEVVSVLAGSLLSYSQEELGSFVQFHQGRLMKLLANLQGFQQPPST